MNAFPLLAASILAAALTTPAHAGPHGTLIVPRTDAQGEAKPKGAARTKLVYYGGPVISNAKVYAVFWTDKVAGETQKKIGGFFADMLDSDYMDWLSEYNTNLPAVDGRPGTDQTIGRGTFNGSFTIQPSNAAKNLPDAVIRKELEAQVAAGKLPAPDGNSLYMLYFPAGYSMEIEGMRSCVNFLAYHEGFTTKSGAPIYYGIMPICGMYSFFSLTTVSSHEAIEAITDPFPTPGDKPAYPQAWNTTDGMEISDLCTEDGANLNGRTGLYRVQAQWQNSIGGCVNRTWTTAPRKSMPPAHVAASTLRSRAQPLLEAGRQATGNWDGRLR